MHFFYYPDSSILAIAKYRFTRTLRVAASYWLQRTQFSAGYKTLRKLKGSARGRSAFVFANGPSVGILDPAKVKGTGFDVFAVNGYLFSAFSQVATPTHYVLSDPACLDVRDAGTPSNRHLEISKKYAPLFNTLDTLNATLLVPMQYVSRQKSKRVIGFCDIENELSRNASDITKPRGYLSMTAYKELAIALFMGYDSIYICGFDNDYFQRLEADENNEAFYADAHFFGDPEKHSVKTEGAHVGEFLYVHHFLFSNFGKFPPGTIVNLHKASLNTFFSKKHDLDIYK